MSAPGEYGFKWVGHRGFPENFPENSLPGMLAALQKGANGLEFDVQLSADGELVVIHDDNLKRVAGIDRNVAELNVHELADISVHEPLRFGRRFEPTPLLSLHQFCLELSRSEAMLSAAKGPFPGGSQNQNWPLIFVEIKSSVFKSISYRQCIEKLLPAIHCLQKHCVVISFDLDFIRAVQQQINLPVGWVLEKYSKDSLSRVQNAPVDFLIGDFKKLPKEGGLWPGAWQWFVYDIVKKEDLIKCLDLGVSWIETWNVEAMVTIGSQLPKGLQRPRDGK